MAQLITAAQNFTSGWVDLGSPIPAMGIMQIGFFLTVDINDSLNARIRAVGLRHDADTVDYPLPIKTVGTSSVTLEPELFEFNVDADQNLVLDVVTDDIVPYVQMQIMAGTVGGTAGQIDAADYFVSRARY